MLILLFAAGCSNVHTQKGVDLDNKKGFATIYTDTEKNHRWISIYDKRVYITHLDEDSLYRMGWDFSYPDIVHVALGVHRIEIEYDYMNMFSRGCLWLDAKSGEDYIVRNKAKGYTMFFWIENLVTNRRVGGICGSEPTQ